MKVCGPKYALCGLIISAWGVVQLVLMGFFFFMKSVAMVEDLGLEEIIPEMNTTRQYYMAADNAFNANAQNCWIAACIYVITFLFSGHQFYLNSRSSLAV